jgi:uncharacterized protein YcbK (DUF882 family)
MSPRRTTIMILAPGRDAIHLELPVLPLRAATLCMLVPLLLGISAQRLFGVARSYPIVAMGSLHRIEARTFRRLQSDHQPLRAAMKATPVAAIAHAAPAPARELPVGPPPPPGLGETTLRTLMTAVRPAEAPLQAMLVSPLSAANVSPLSAAGLRAVKDTGLAALDGPVISVKSILKALSSKRRESRDVEPGAVPINGVLRIQALHLDETLSTRPFDDLLRPDPRAFADVSHLMRCRVTGHEIQMDPKLVGILAQLSTLYGRTLQLISGHRAPHANGTSETSQHTLGRAADIRIPGVSIAELKRVAIKLGARGVGLYPEKGFVHVDVREKQRYFWIYTARAGEQADLGSSPPRAARTTDEPAASDEGGEQGDQGATSGDAELPALEPEHEHEHAETSQGAEAEELTQ